MRHLLAQAQGHTSRGIRFNDASRKKVHVNLFRETPFRDKCLSGKF